MADQIKWNGHTFLCSSAVTADMDFRACGTAEELCMGIAGTPGPLGYDQTKKLHGRQNICFKVFPKYLLLFEAKRWNHRIGE
ncbi:MAG: hypothetical protein DRP52_00030 [Planctomycetota bacterium]|nr:MAG: hypothetical protein DRP52_00030 [Planctomycetota bacterium]